MFEPNKFGGVGKKEQEGDTPRTLSLCSSRSRRVMLAPGGRSQLSQLPARAVVFVCTFAS